MLFFNVLIIGAILAFVFTYSLANSGMRGQYVIDGIGGRMEGVPASLVIISSSIEGAYSPQELIESMTAAVRQFVGETEQSDDLTMLAIKYT